MRFYDHFTRTPAAFPCPTDPGRIFFIVKGSHFKTHLGNSGAQPSTSRPSSSGRMFPRALVPGRPVDPGCGSQAPGRLWAGPWGPLMGKKPWTLRGPGVSPDWRGCRAHRKRSRWVWPCTGCAPLGGASCLPPCRGWGGSSRRGWHRSGPVQSRQGPQDSSWSEGPCFLEAFLGAAALPLPLCPGPRPPLMEASRSTGCLCPG